MVLRSGFAKQSGVGKAEIVVLTESDVVKNADSEDLRSFDQAVCAVAVFPRERRVSTRMIMLCVAPGYVTNFDLKHSWAAFRASIGQKNRLIVIRVCLFSISTIKPLIQPGIFYGIAQKQMSYSLIRRRDASGDRIFQNVAGALYLHYYLSALQHTPVSGHKHLRGQF
jgi:hypothetical protein